MQALPTNSDERLQILKQLLPELPIKAFKYGTLLSEIQDCQTTINANAQNYRRILDFFNAESFPRDDLRFLQLEETWKLFQEQIKIDLTYLNSGLELFEHTIATIRGMTEIERTTSERAFQHAVQIWGIGLATAATAATAISPFVPTLLKIEGSSDRNEPLPIVAGGIDFLFTVLFSIMVGILAKGAAEAWVKARQAKVRDRIVNKNRAEVIRSNSRAK